MEKDEKDFYNQQSKIQALRDSHIKKQEFIDLISKLNFDTIEDAKIHFITGYQYIPETEDKKEYIKTYGFDFNIY